MDRQMVGLRHGYNHMDEYDVDWNMDGFMVGLGLEFSQRNRLELEYGQIMIEIRMQMDRWIIYEWKYLGLCCCEETLHLSEFWFCWGSGAAPRPAAPRRRRTYTMALTPRQ